MDELYAEYGKLMVEAELLQVKINEVKQKINQGLTKTE